MIKTIKITDLAEAAKVASSYDHNFNAWIITIDPEDSYIALRICDDHASKNIPVFMRCFRDFDDNDDNVETEGPRKEDILDIIEFFKDLHSQEKEYNIGVNCHAGVSRSPAIGMIGWMVANHPPEIALDKISKVRPYCYPNTRILRLYDEVAGTGAYHYISQWFAENTKNGIYINPAW